jgi:2-amino-4-hydroxy-6-hydroxymethyldihydropteridine diphosphokinase
MSPAPGSGRVRAYLGLGSNLGDRPENLGRAVALLGARDGVAVVRTSSVYETAPVGPAQPDFLNAVAEVDTTLSPRDLLEACLGVEEEMGRVRGERWGPRVIDVDLLLYDDERVDEPNLVVPHPRMHERAFVLVPLAELAPDVVLPDGRTIGEAARAELDRAIAEGYRTIPQTNEEASLATAATRALIGEEPWGTPTYTPAGPEPARKDRNDHG